MRYGREMLRKVSAKLRRWFSRSDRPDGGGPGGGPNSHSYNRARAEVDVNRFIDGGGGGVV